MKEIYAEAKTVAVSSVAALCFLTATPDAAFAQGGRTMPVERRTEVLNRQGVEKDLEKSNRELKGVPEKPADHKRAHMLAEQIKQDFEGLQESYNLIVLSMAEKAGLNRNHDSVFRAVAEIKKCSTRLKTNLALPKPQQQEEARAEGSSEQIEESLMTLRKHIYDFITNPLFESHGVLDVEQGRKAGRDLDRIIELSESLKRRAEELKKPN